MGRVSPGKNKTQRFSLPGDGGFRWKWPMLRPRHDDEAEPTGRPLMDLLKRLWHMPDQFHWMGALPLGHRRWVLVAALVVIVAILWPYSPDAPAPPAVESARTAPGQVIQAELVGNPANSAEAPPSATDKGQVHHYRIAEGQTLAQLFRQHNLPVGDVFAMAQSEGDDKPLSSLQAGQQVEIEQNAQGVVTSLEIETSATSRIRFIRQPDGSYRRN